MSLLYCSVIDSTSVGCLVQLKGWRAAFRLLAAIHLALFGAHIVLESETLERRISNDDPEVSRPRNNWCHFRVYDHVGRPAVLLPALAYAVVFSYTTVLVVRLPTFSHH